MCIRDRGTIVQVTEDEICVNIGYKSDGLIKKEDLALSEDIPLTEAYHPGDEIEAEIITLNDGEGNVRLSRRKIESQLRWKELIANLDEDKFYDVTVSYTHLDVYKRQVFIRQTDLIVKDLRAQQEQKGRLTKTLCTVAGLIVSILLV